ncbi:MAG TPA: phage holin family protein [Candidatus Binatia bacterium]|jgi:uncharacterized membrane protein YqjE|nr:phage holin family protein [Candidatus Binatia bacterium]
MALEKIGQRPARPTGLFDIARSLLYTGIDLLHVRVDLVCAELEEQWSRLKEMALLAVIAFFGAGFGVLCLSLLIVAIFWDNHRFYALGGLVVFYLGLALIAVQILRKKALSRPRFLSATLSELAKDYESLKS